MTGIAAVQARIAELEQLVAPRPATSTVAPSELDFAAALSSAGLALTPTVPAAQQDDGGVTANIAPGSGVSAQDLIEAAKRYTGTPYVWGGESLSEGGLDCSGLVLRSLTDLGIGDGIPRVARQQQTLGEKVGSLDEALPGDLLIFGGGTHIAIYVGDGTMIDAPKPGGTVGVRDVWAEPTNIRRILPQESATATSAPVTGLDLARIGLASGALSSGTVSSGTFSSGALAGTGAGLASLAGLLGGTSTADATSASQAAWQVLLSSLGTSTTSPTGSLGTSTTSPIGSLGLSTTSPIGSPFTAGSGLDPQLLLAALTGGAAA